MRGIVSILKGTLVRKAESKHFELELAKKGDDIIKILEGSRRTGAVVGIYSQMLGEGMFLTKVESIHMESTHDEKIISFNRYDMSGNILSVNRVAVSEIWAVCAFPQPFKNPVLSSEKVELLRQAVSPH